MVASPTDVPEFPRPTTSLAMLCALPPAEAMRVMRRMMMR